MTNLSGPILFNNSTGSDSAASGCGPATAVNVTIQTTGGSNTATASWTGTISAGDLMYIPDPAFLGRRYNVIASVGSGSLTFDNNWDDSSLGTSGYVGGKRAGANLTTDSIWGDAPSGAVIEIEYTGTNYQLNGTWYPTRTTATDAIKIKGTGSSKPVIEGGASNIQHIRLNNGTWSFENIEFLFTRTTSGSMIDLDYGTAYTSLYNCKFSKSNTSVGGLYLQKVRALASKVVECVFDGNNGAMPVGYTCSSQAYISTSLHNCVFHGFSQSAVDMNRGQEGVVEGCLFYDCAKAINYSGSSYVGGDTIKGNIFHDISGDAISYTNANNTIQQGVMSNIFSSIGGHAISATSVFGQSDSAIFDRNAFYSITGSNYNNLTAGSNDITLDASPFVDPTASPPDFNLNSNLGGGSVLRSTKYTLGG